VTSERNSPPIYLRHEVKRVTELRASQAKIQADLVKARRGVEDLEAIAEALAVVIGEYEGQIGFYGYVMEDDAS
jgi:hypothetical protein